MQPKLTACAAAGAAEAFRYVVVGAGPCGGRAAAGLAGIAGAGSVCLIGDEAVGPYERPRLSKQCLVSAKMEGPATLGWADDGLVTRYLGDAAVALDTASHVVETASGRRIVYEKLLIATGARARKLALDGDATPDVRYLRSHGDALALRTQLKRSRRVLIIGGGFIGLEVAASARTLGCEVTLVEASDQLMARAVPSVVADAVRRKFLSEGVAIHLADPPTLLRRHGIEITAHLRSGTVIDSDLVVTGIGSVPNVELADGAGLALDNGILVDEKGRTSDPDVFAAGDVANRLVALDGGRQRLEAWEPALDQAAAIVAVMTGRPETSPRAPWIWSDQFDWNLQLLGHADARDSEIVRGDPRSGRFLVVWLTATGAISGAVAVNAGSDMAMCRRAMAGGLMATADGIRDEAVPLRNVFRRIS